MKRVIKTILSTLTVFAVTACAGGDNKTAALTEAQRAADAGDFTEAVSICNNLMTSADTASLTAGDYCDVAMIYALAADNDFDRDANIAVAARWFERANTISSDSVKAFLGTVPPEQMSIIKQLEQLTQNRGIDFSAIEDPEYGEYEMPMDSLPSHDEHGDN